jgi:hypothetical protein
MDKQEIEREVELRDREYISICESCGEPIWNEWNRFMFADDVCTHKGKCGPGEELGVPVEELDVNQHWLREEIAKEMSLLLTHDELSNKRLNRLMQQLKIYRVDDGAYHWVWADDPNLAVKVVERAIGATMAEMDIEPVSVERLTPQDIKDFQFHDENGRPVHLALSLVEDLVSTAYIASSEF